MRWILVLMASTVAWILTPNGQAIVESHPASAALPEFAERTTSTDGLERLRQVVQLQSINQMESGPPVPAASPAPPPVQLRLAAIQRGRRTLAVIEGILGHEGGAIVELGETVGGVRLVQVDRDGALIQYGGRRAPLPLGGGS